MSWHCTTAHTDVQGHGKLACNGQWINPPQNFGPRPHQHHRVILAASDGDETALHGLLQAALLLQLWDDTKPRVKTLAELRAAKRPVIEFFELDDTPFDLSKRAGR